jgi:hypothetical protein
MSAQYVSDPKHWRDRAAQMRALSGWMNDDETKMTMLKLADEYDMLAERRDARWPIWYSSIKSKTFRAGA